MRGRLDFDGPDAATARPGRVAFPALPGYSPPVVRAQEQPNPVGGARPLSLLGPVTLLIGIVATIITTRYPATWLVLATDGLAPLLLIAAMWGIGSLFARQLLPAPRHDLRALCIAVALGSGVISLATLALGLAGILSHRAAWALVIVGIACGIPEWKRIAHQRPRDRHAWPRPHWTAALTRYVGAALLALPLALVLIGACLPPGVLWPDEAGGYDVLEYHLEAPREFFDAGRIHFLEYNVYAAFPQLVEMQYLLLMHLMDGAWTGAIPAQLLHAAYGIFAVLAIAAWSPPGVARAMAASLAGTTPWLAYLGCLAYVENALLFFTAVAGGILLGCFESPAAENEEQPPPAVPWRLFACNGLIAGFAVGCKLTAAAMVGLALAIAWLVGARRPPASRVRGVAMFCLACLLACSPWLLRSAVQTGNPLYPFAYSLFDGRAWSADQARQWARGHAVGPGADTVTGRFAIAARELVLLDRADAPKGELPFSKFGILVVAGIAGSLSFSPWTRMRLPFLATWLGFAIVVWTLGTQIPGRFAVPLVAPLVWLAAGPFARQSLAAQPTPARAAVQAILQRFARRLAAIVGPLLLFGCGIVALAQFLAFTAYDRDFSARTGIGFARLIGQTDAFAGAVNALSAALPADSRTLLIGDGAVFYFDKPIRYATVFNRDPWVARAAAGAPARELVADLRREGFTHVAFDWSEIARLRRTYGFPEIVTPAFAAALEAAGLERVRPPADLATALDRAQVEILALPR